MGDVKIFTGRCSPCTEPIQSLDTCKDLEYLIFKTNMIRLYSYFVCILIAFFYNPEYNI